MYIDTHAHIYSEEFDQDRDYILERCRELGVEKIYMPNVDHSSIDRMMEVEEKNKEQCMAMMGLHPCSVDKNFEKELYLVEDWFRKRDFAAVGEIGIDLFHDTTYKEQQEEALKIQVGLAKQYNLPVVIHCRNSFRETVDLLSKVRHDDLIGIFHCFSGTLEEAREVIEMNFYIGIGGVLTFKNGGLDKFISEIDLKHIVLETDSPYLAPVPHRGKRNEPSYIPLIAEKLANIKKIGLEEVEKITTQNALRIFKY